MNVRPDLERSVVDALLETAPSHEPDHLFQAIVVSTSRLRPRPRWLALLKESPMSYRSTIAAGSPTMRLAATMIATLLLILTVVGTVVAGASLLPSPAEPPPPPSFFTGTASTSGACRIANPTIDAAAGVVHSRGESWGCLTWSTDDPRFSGTSEDIWNADDYQAGTDSITDRGGRIVAGRERIENEDGAWEGTWTELDVETFHQVAGWFEGEGAYAGLAAYVVITDPEGSGTVWGMISPTGRLDPPEALVDR